MKRYSNEPEIRLDYWIRYIVLFKLLDYSRTIFPIYATIHNELIQENHLAFCFTPMPANRSSHKRKNPPSRSDFESFIWELYYQEFQLQVIKKGHKSQLMNDKYHDPEIPFSAIPIWTGKGLFMRIEIIHDHPEIARLVLDKKEEFARHYLGCIMKVRMKSGRPYRIDIQLHDAPVSDFIESSARAIYYYALEIRKQQLDLMHHI